VDIRYKHITEYVVRQFSEHLGSRLISVYVKGSVARNDAVWGISDLDLVLAFDAPTQRDTMLKNEVEEVARSMAGGDALVLQRIAEERLNEMDEKTKAFWLYSSNYDSEVLYGKHPSSFLPAPLGREESAKAILSIVKDEGKDIEALVNLDAKGCRLISKRILQAAAMFLVYNGYADYVPLTKVADHPLLHLQIRENMPYVIEAFLNPRYLTDVQLLVNAWRLTWNVIDYHVFSA
jgi:predicted nucleotidyltransferase